MAEIAPPQAPDPLLLPQLDLVRRGPARSAPSFILGGAVDPPDAPASGRREWLRLNPENPDDDKS